MRHRFSGLVPRTLAASAVVAALVAAALVLLIVSVSRSHRSLDRQSHSKEVAVATVTLQGVVSDLDSALRGFILTRSNKFFTAWERAHGQLPSSEKQLRQLVAADSTERGYASTLTEQISSYVNDYALPLFGIAQIEPKTAAGSVAQLEDKRRLDQIRSSAERMVSLENRRAAASASSVREESNRAIEIGLVVLGLAVAMILMFGLYLATAVARPVRRVAAAAGEVAGGDFSGRLSPEGPGEVADLGRAFNAMAQSLDQGRQELLRQNELLVQSERHKSELISIVSHEVRTPLASLLGFTDLLLRRDLDDETRRRYVQIVHQESRRLASLTTDFLDVRLLEEGRLELTRAKVDLAEIAREQAQVFVSTSEKHPLSLDLPERPIWVDGDRDRLSQVVGNLVANAIKYSPDGGEVEIRSVETDGRVRLEVEDHGLGIPLEDQPMIFTKFYRGHAGGSGIPGTGLGLAIAHELVRAHGGTIDFDSELGRGTTFRLELPAIAA